MLGRGGNMCFHHFENEEVVFVDKRVIVQLTFEVGMALTDKRCLDLLCLIQRQPEFPELINLSTRCIADSDYKYPSIPQSAD